VILFYYGSGSGNGTVINYRSGSDFLARYGSDSVNQKVTVATVPVPQRWFNLAMPVLRYLTRNKYPRLMSTPWTN
jgi:hypothetical protein